jgi:sucrose phosphorylase
MNIVYFDALNHPSGGDSIATQVDRFLVAQAIMLSLAGMPGIYFHSLFGSRNDRPGALTSGINRRINRQKLSLAELESELRDPQSLRSTVFARYRALLRVRRSHPAFNPHAHQEILSLDPRVFAVLRAAPSGDRVLCLHNVTDSCVTVELSAAEANSAQPWTDLLSGQPRSPDASGALRIPLRAYEVSWLVAPGASRSARPEL